MVTWGSIDWGGKLGVATSATSTGGYHFFFSGAGEIMNDLAGHIVRDDRSHRNLQGNIFAACAVTLAALSVASASGLMFRIIAEVEQCVRAFGRFDINRSTVATITTRRPAARNEFLPAKRCHAITAVSAFYMNFRAVNKHR